MNQHREIILGPPGTGKTTELIRRLEAAFEQGVKPEEVAYLAFTKKAADVAVQRSMEHFGFGRQRFPYFRTIHSLAFHENKIRTQSVMRPENYKELGERYGWDFTASYDDYEERPSYGNGLGDKLLQCYDLAKARGISPKAEAVQGDYQFGEFAVERFVEQFEMYKSRYGLYTFNDFLDTPAKLDIKIAIVDEAQDLTHQQWHFIRESFRHVPTVWIAGDDDQCIYQWSGADLNFFLKLEAQITQLKKSHRCDRAIWEMANKISSRIGSRYKKTWQPVHEGGSVTVDKDAFNVDISKGEWMLLVRKNRHLMKYHNVCMSAGRIFFDGRKWINENKWFRGVLAYMNLREGRKINALEAMNLVRSSTLVTKKAELNEYEWEAFDWAFRDRPQWDEVCDKLSFEQLTFIKKCIANGENIHRHGNIRLSTIHAAKGGEADNVMLDMRLDGIPLKQFRKDPDSERRIWYVGVSRARHNLVLTGATHNEAVEI